MTFFRNYSFERKKQEELGEGIMLRTLPLVDAIDKYGTNLFRSEIEISTNGTKIDTDHNHLLNGAILHSSRVESNITMPNGEVLPKGVIADIWIPKDARIYRESFFGPPKASELTLYEMVEKNLITGVSIEGRRNPKTPNKITIPYISICTEELGSEYAGEMEIIYKRNMKNDKIDKRCLCDLPVNTYVTNPEKTGIWSIIDVTDTSKTIQNINDGQEDIFDDTMPEWNHYFAVSKEDVMQYLDTTSETYTEEDAEVQKDEFVRIYKRTCAMCNAKSKKAIEVIEKRMLEAEETAGTEISKESKIAELEGKFVEMQTDFLAKLESLQLSIDTQNQKIAELEAKANTQIDEVVTRSMNQKTDEFNIIKARLDAIEQTGIVTTNLPKNKETTEYDLSKII